MLHSEKRFHAAVGCEEIEGKNLVENLVELKKALTYQNWIFLDFLRLKAFLLWELCGISFIEIFPFFVHLTTVFPRSFPLINSHCCLRACKNYVTISHEQQRNTLKFMDHILRRSKI